MVAKTLSLAEKRERAKQAEVRKKLEKIQCSQCGVLKAQRFYYKTSNPEKDRHGKITVCIDCVNKIFEDARERYSSIEQAIDRACKHTDLAYIEEAAELTIRDMDKEVFQYPFSKYVTHMYRYQKDGSTRYTERNCLALGIIAPDTDLFEQWEKDKKKLHKFIEEKDRLINKQQEKIALLQKNNESLLEKVENKEIAGGALVEGSDYKKDELIDLQDKWATTNEAHIRYLEREYNDWANRYDVDSKSMEYVVQRICLTQLQLRITNDAKETASLNKQLLDLMDSSNLTPKKEGLLANDTETSFGELIKHIEKSKPIPEPTKELADVDKLTEFGTWIVGHIGEMLGQKNAMSTAYEIKKEKYDVNNIGNVIDVDEIDDDEDEE